MTRRGVRPPRPHSAMAAPLSAKACPAASSAATASFTSPTILRPEAAPPARQRVPLPNGFCSRTSYPEYHSLHGNEFIRLAAGANWMRTLCSSPGKTKTPLARNRQFESSSLQRRVRCEPVSRGNSPSYVEKPRFSAGVRRSVGGAVGGDAQRGAISHQKNGDISIGPYSSTAVLPAQFGDRGGAG